MTGLMNNELERIWKEAIMVNVRVNRRSYSGWILTFTGGVGISNPRA
jgi:hypothetical protein